jgi:MFS family permease
MGFGIFYMMVNVGGMIGPMIAGYVRAWSWDYVFVASSACIAVNIIVLLLFYQEPTTEATSTQRRTVKKVLNDMMDVMGNWRFFTTIFVILILMMCASNEWLSWRLVGISALIWLAFNFAIDIPLKNTKNKFHIPPMKIGNWRFALYLLILSGFWASFEQIFITMPEYIRDYVDTKDMLTGTFGGFFNTLANIDPNVIAGILQNRIHDLGIMMTPDELNKLVQDLLAARVRVEPEQVKLLIERTITIGQTVSQDQFLEMAKQLIVMGKQVNPEYIINFDAAAIVVFQVLVSYIIARWNPFSAMVSGIMVASIGIGVSAFIHSGWPIALAIVVFGFGEMMASPKSQEYIGRIAPREQTGMYMGYYFWAVALGN